SLPVSSAIQIDVNEVTGMKTSLTVTCVLLLAGAVALTGQGRGAQGGRGGGAPQGAAAPRPAPTNFPNRQRAAGDPAVVARGKSLYEINCRSCHGADLRGGDQGGPNLLRSQLVLNDQHGELILPVVKNGRMNPGMPVMPPLPLPEPDVKAIAEYIHSVAATMQR